jgi:signal transduction histidine kinase
MRYDDMIATVLAQPADRPDRRAAQWRQLVDLLAQPRSEAGGGERSRAFVYLREHRASVPASVRAEAARTLAGLPIDPELVLFFAEDAPSVAAPLIAGARLAAEEWLAVLPRLGPRGRALLRHRRDVPARVKQALAAFGAADFVLEGAAAEGEAKPAEQSESQIRELVERIEAFRRHKKDAADAAYAVTADAVTTTAPPPQPAQTFRWETASDGVLRWVHGSPREALVGQSIAVIAGPGQQGVDGQAAGAFEKRSPFRDARLSVAGEGAAAGDWRISGVPFFDPHRGAFLGYRGTARRPRVDEVAGSMPESASGVFGTHFPADSLRQLIHELRTPLNAIIGFAEMIEGQYMGPAAAGYRGQAAEIMEQARRLLSAVDDLDTAARLETQRLEMAEGAVDAAALLGRLHESYERIARQRGARLMLDVGADLPPARVEAGAAERMLARLLAATVGLAGEGEAIVASVGAENRGGASALRVAIDRPKAIAGLAEAALLDPGYSPDGDWPAAPALGLGFALRLVRNLAEAAGGALDIGPTRISLFLPAIAGDAPAAGQSEGSG